MKIDVDELSAVERKVRVELPPEKVAGEFAKAYQDLGKRVRIKGFRAGKAPRRILEGMYRDEVVGQVRSQLVENSLSEIIRERGFQLVSRPEIEANELHDGGAFSFSAIFEVKPEIEAKDYLDVELEKVRLGISDDQVGQALERLRESHAHLEPVENRDIVERGDFVTLDFEGSLGGKPFSGGKGENYLLEIGGSQALPQFQDAIVGLKTGEPHVIQITYPDTYPNREIAGKEVDFTVIVRDIKHKVLPPLDDEFAKDHGECGSLEELKSIIRSRLENELTELQKENLKEQLVQRLIEKNSFSPPPSMVERQTRYLMERNQNRSAPASAQEEPAPSSDEIRKNLEPRALRQVQATLLVERIAQLENIQVDDKQVQERVDLAARAAGERAKSVREYYGGRDAREELRAQIAFDRTLDFLLDRARVKEVDPPNSLIDEGAEKR